ncbi:YbjN domain-containing protein [Marinobacterium weihaiense]|uniref:YbjN domain-containing protein n=1 Tax=Marinobacterium weihaiense TaxID=2851016 RepID=A0ABS6MAK2_9GAMM|nr:YbjN domain-containing protein [Marinobacterium weihaiense]MBV0933316.1 YbjN domain-containing protein [Marinobacterium weihaiense]
MRKPVSFLLALATTSLLVAPVSADSLVSATTPERIVDVARGFGSASLSTDNYGDPLITGRIEGIKYGIFFYSCTDNADCKDVQFSAVWSDINVSLSRLNEWNREMRFGKAYLDADGDPTLEMAVNLRHGVSQNNLDDTIDWWRVASTDFEKFINEAEDTGSLITN